MAREFAKQFYSSSRWIKCRASYIESINGLCEECTRQGMINPGYILHHKIELSPDNINDPSITLGWDNLEYLCLKHHNYIHNPSQSVTRDDVIFNEYGELVRKDSML